MTQFLGEAERIGNALVAAIDADWSCWSRDANDKLDASLPHARFDIYTGTAGMLLFLLELYRLTGTDRLGQAAVEGLAWLWPQRAALPAGAFLTGSLGYGRLLVRAAHILGEPDYLEQALDLARSEDGSAAMAVDYIDGLGGNIVGLLHLHAASDAPFLLEALETCAAAICNRARPGPSGIYWDANPQDVHGLTGLAHGAAGLALAWLLLGRYLKNRALTHVACQALDYVGHHYDAEHGNWSDFRMYFGAAYEAPARRAYLARDWEHFKWSCFRNSWCNGAAGIGMVLLRAYRETGNQTFLAKARAAIQLTEAEMAGDGETAGKQDDILCHGRAGNAEIFLEAHDALAEEDWLVRARQVGGHMMAERERQGRYRLSDGQWGLFTGLAGIGYFFCRLADPAGTPSILLPDQAPAAFDLATNENLPTLTSTLPKMRRRLLEKAIPRTLTLLAQAAAGTLGSWLAESPAPSEKAGFADFVVRCLAEDLNGTRAGEVIGDAFGLESTKAAVADGVDANGRLFVKERMVADRLERFRQRDDDALAPTTLGADPDLVLCQTRWDWSGDDPDSWLANLDADSGEYHLLLLPRARGMQEVPLSPLSAFLISAFLSPTTVGAVIQALATSLGGTASEAEIRHTGLAQIRALLEAHFLVDEDLARLLPERQP